MFAGPLIIACSGTAAEVVRQPSLLRTLPIPPETAWVLAPHLAMPPPRYPVKPMFGTDLEAHPKKGGEGAEPDLELPAPGDCELFGGFAPPNVQSRPTCAKLQPTAILRPAPLAAVATRAGGLLPLPAPV